MSVNPFEILYDEFEKIELKGEVDLAIIKNIEKAIEACSLSEKYWVEYSDDISSSFSFYHALRNSRIITEKIRKRVLNSKKENDNPQIAVDALKILPLLSEIFSVQGKHQKTEILNSVETYISNRSRILREKAYNTNLLPTSSEESAGLDRRRVRRGFNRFSKKILVDLFEI